MRLREGPASFLPRAQETISIGVVPTATGARQPDPARLAYHPAMSTVAGPADTPAVALSDRVRAFLEVPRMAVVATLNPDGTPLQAVVWYLVRGDTLVLNSKLGRAWPRNVLRDPRIDIAVHDEYDWVGLRGRVEPVHDPEQSQADIAEMAHRYHAADPARVQRRIAAFRTEQRISFVLRPAEIYEHFEDD